MNYKSIILSAVAVCTILAVAFTVSTDIKSNKYYAEAKKIKSDKEAAEALGSAEYFHMLRANPETGEIDPRDVALAEQQLIAMSKMSNKTTDLNTLEWDAQGPDNTGGRTRGLICDMTDPNKLYMGMVSGGFWSSPDGGNTWSRIAGNDSITRTSVSTIAQAANGDLYYGTGESFTSGGTFQGSLGFPGNGVYKSTDGGLTVSHLASTGANYNSQSDIWSFVNKLVAHPTDANKIIAATSRGMRQTTDGGATWSLLIPQQLPFLDVEISSTGNVIVGATASNIYISTDGGGSFQPVNSTSFGLPGGTGVNRVEVAIAPSDENVIYAVMSVSGGTRGVYKTSDKGANWVTIGQGGSQAFNPLGDQGYYDIAFGVHPTDPGILFLGGQLELWRYISANSQWQVIGQWQNSASAGLYVHADMHGIQFNSSNPDIMYVVTDGGFFRTQDCRAASPFFVEKNKNYETIQCYGVAANTIGHIIFGAQDNGTKLINGEIANSPKSGKDQLGGDGMRGAASDISYGYLFGESQNGVMRRSADGGTSVASFSSIFDVNIDAPASASTLPDGDPDEGAPWVAPVELKENANGTATKSVLFIGLDDNVWFTQDAVSTDKVIWFPLFTRANAQFSSIALNDAGTVAYVGDRSGRVTRVTGIDLYNTKYRYDDTITNNLDDGFTLGNSFVSTAMPNALFGGSYISDLECNGAGNELLVTVPYYNRSTHVYRSLNANSASPTMSNITGNLPPMPVYCGAVLNAPNSYLVGTDFGVFGTDNGGATWTEMNNVDAVAEGKWHPRVAVTEIVVKPIYNAPNGDGWRGEVIYTGTYGRGTYRSTSYASLNPVSVENTAKSNKQLSVYPNPVSNVASVQFDAAKAGYGGIQVISLTGRVLKQQQVNLVAGDNNIEVDMSGLSRGVYMIHMNSANGHVTAKVIKR